jgi:hypothetical protein
MKQLDPQTIFGHLDSNTVQTVLNPQIRLHITGAFARAPAGLRTQLATSFEHFLETVKIAFTHSFDHIFVVSTVLMCVALVIVCFLPQIELRKTTRPVLEEVGIELEEELGQSDDERAVVV